MLDPSKALFRGCGPRFSRCPECFKSFSPHPRLKSRQKTCTQKKCLLAHRAKYRKKYRRANLQAEEDYRAKAKLNRSSGYWKTYRKTHPHSTQRNRSNSKLRKRLKRAGLQRQLDIVQVLDPPGYFDLFEAFAMSHRSLIENCHATSAA